MHANTIVRPFKEDTFRDVLGGPNGKHRTTALRASAMMLPLREGDYSPDA